MGNLVINTVHQILLTLLVKEKHNYKKKYSYTDIL